MRRIMSWIESFTIAIIEENYTHIGDLIESVPQFETVDEAITACALIQEALIMIQREKESTFEAMQKLKKTRQFIDTSTESYIQEYRG
ncbi:hypothetical protein [Sulfurospirillum diekertiae]|uniref:hypothetical protein n=1 Tax=Sulfurospirillum diekertiae TaxID=1854492 RepID=UPI001E620591|nr:hypothetical protein [Sulfurospirillum diekertiae]